MNNKKTKQDFENWNESMSRKYNPDKYHNSSNFIVHFIEKKRTQKIIDFLDLEQKDKIIEIGCGTGNIIEKIKTGSELMGVDLSDFMLNLAKNKRYSIKTKFIKANVENLPDEITVSKFDKIYCSEVLEHVENPEKVLSEILKITKPNSLVVISVPNEKNINVLKNILKKLNIFNLFFPGISKKMDDEWHLHSFDLELFKQICPNNLEIKKIARIPFSFLPLRYVIKLRSL